MPITRPGRPFCKISSLIALPEGSTFFTGRGLLCTEAATWGAIMHWSSPNLTLPPHLTLQTSQQLLLNHKWRDVAKGLLWQLQSFKKDHFKTYLNLISHKQGVYHSPQIVDTSGKACSWSDQGRPQVLDLPP